MFAGALNYAIFPLAPGFPAAISSGFRLSFFHEDAARTAKRPRLLYRLIGIDPHFTRADRLIAVSIFSYAILMVSLVGVMTLHGHPSQG